MIPIIFVLAAIVVLVAVDTNQSGQP